LAVGALLTLLLQQFRCLRIHRRRTREYLASPLADRFSAESWQELRVITDGEYVVHDGTRTGRWPGGEFFGVPASAGDYAREVVFMYRVSDGKVAERWAIRDDLGFLRQLGAPLT
jgi:predicted ester cyclase